MLLHPTYFPNLAHFVVLVNAEKVTFEICDNYQKQTFRNRCDIFGANGKLTLSIPVSYTQKQRQTYKEVQIFNDSNWQQQHLKSLDSAYRMSPFFEFYRDDLLHLFQTKYDSLLEFNLACFEAICHCLEFKCSFALTENYRSNTEAHGDFRGLVNPKQQRPISFNHYTQVFTQKHGYLPNLSILDLLFNEGPNTLNYLESQHLPI